VAATTVLFTGFPGFLGSELLPRVLARRPEARAVCLVQRKFANLAHRKARALVEATPALAGRIDLIQGDITEGDLRLGPARELKAEVREIYHLAAVYDLSVPRPTGILVNVRGTRHVLDFAESCPRFESLHYVSTCYVSGNLPGLFRETDLDRGQKFNNHYEETKFLAEVEVQKRMKAGLPAAIYRPAIVVGDSETGATQKYDGPYYVLRWLLRQLRIGVMPVVGNPRAHTVNLVPSDFVVRAIAHLSAGHESVGKVYQLCDPAPLSVDELIDLFARATGRKLVRLPMTRVAAKAAIDWMPGVYRLMQIPAATVDYFVQPTVYTCDNTLADLAGTDIAVPPLRTYVDRLVAFMRDNPTVGSQAMV